MQLLNILWLIIVSSLLTEMNSLTLRRRFSILGKVEASALPKKSIVLFLVVIWCDLNDWGGSGTDSKPLHWAKG
jgi:hypothetical protein